VTPLSGDERRALALLAALLLLASAARWLERPRSLLDDTPDADIASLEQASRAAKHDRADAATPRRGAPRGAAASLPAATATPAAAERGASGYTPDEQIDPNRATIDELTRLPGVGPALAARIVAERERAPFASAADLRRVAGIGATLAIRLAPHLTLPPAPQAAARGERAANPPPATSPATGAAPADPTPIDLNAASAEQLLRISGVGPAIAARLVARRDSLGRFRSYDDVDAVRGVGPALLARIRAATVLR
jgi:competence protein ComEA